MYVTPIYALEDVFNLVVTTFRKGKCQNIAGGKFISCGDNDKMTVSFHKNETSATLCVYDQSLMTVCNSSVKPVYSPTQQANGDSPEKS